MPSMRTTSDGGGTTPRRTWRERLTPSPGSTSTTTAERRYRQIAVLKRHAIEQVSPETPEWTRLLLGANRQPAWGLHGDYRRPARSGLLIRR